MAPPPIPAALRAGRRSLEGLPGVALLDDWSWNADYGRWVLRCQLSPGTAATEHVPATTDWYVLVDSEYPWGAIRFYPAKDGGLAATFQHQNHNGPDPEDRPWRSGDPCLDTTVRALDRAGGDDEPYAEHERLRWRFRRALDWLEAAARDALVLPGEPFELPQFPADAEAPTVVYAEGPDSPSVWQGLRDRSGTVELLRVKEGVYAVARFRATGGRPLLAPSWGLALADGSGPTVRGAWIRLDATPVLAPWRVPLTWGELREIARCQGLALDDLLRPILGMLRDGQPHIALIGFPIPARIGDVAAQLHWQPLLLPVLSHGPQAHHGFRPKEPGQWMRDRRMVLTDGRALTWLVAENWHPDQLASRGRLQVEVTAEPLLILGTGALGSALAELLVRAGWHRPLLLDGDRLQAGNLVRHTLGLRELGDPKASAVAARLNAASPHAAVAALDRHFPPPDEQDRERIRRCRVVVDTTGSDAALQALAAFPWDGPRLFISVSLGLGARRLYCFTAAGDAFPHDDFRRQIGPWLARDRTDWADLELPREGIGCWHPVFPARIDDLWLLASVAAKHLAAQVAAPPADPQLVVFEQSAGPEGFAVVRRIDAPSARD